jgi:hypothetical protein
MQPAAPGGISGLLAKPGITQALLAFGSSMLAESDRPGGSLGGALGRSLPSGMQAYGQGQQEAELNKVMEGMDPRMRTLIMSLPPRERAMAMLQLNQKPDPVALGRDQRLVDPGTGEEVAGIVPTAPTASVERGGVRIENLPMDQAVAALDSLPELPPEEMTPYQQEQIRLADERLAMDRDTAARSGGDPVALRKEFASDPVVKQSAALAQAYQTIQSAAQEPSAAGDLALIFNYMKMLDPGSSVREGEFANAQNAAGIPERVRAMFNNTLRGERLTEQTRTDFLDRATRIARGQRQMIQSVAERYSGFANTAGVDPSEVVYDPFTVTGLQQEQPSPKGGVYERFPNIKPRGQ